MNRLFILLTILVCGVAQAQPSAPCLHFAKTIIANHAVRQQDPTAATVMLKARHCSIAAVPDGVHAGFETVNGLDVAVSSMRFSDGDGETTATGVAKARRLSLSLKLSASPDLPAGEHTVHGLLTYQVADASGSLIPESLPISLSFKVIPHRRYKQVAYPSYGRPHADSAFVHALKTAGIVLAEIPLFAFMLIWCPLSGNCPSC